ncbi:MAG TPA: endonuclease/exonuclease/phosphatase family protein [Acidimicrobiales bacterium]
MRLTVTTWNLQGSKGVDPEVVARHCRERRTDVLLLQEVQRQQARQIAGALGAQSCRWSLKHWPVRVRAEGMAILGLTRPVTGVRSRAVTRRWFLWNWRRRIVQIGQVGDLTVANLHLTPHGPTSTADRAREVAWLLGRLGDQGPVAAGGDYNAQPDDDIFRALRAAGLRDAWLTARPDDPDGGRTNWSGRRNRPPMRRIDYLWVTEDVDVVDVEVPTYADDATFAPYPALSDHLPLTTTLEVGVSRG